MFTLYFGSRAPFTLQGRQSIKLSCATFVVVRWSYGWGPWSLLVRIQLIPSHTVSQFWYHFVGKDISALGIADLVVITLRWNPSWDDQSQRLTPTAVKFLTGQGINSIISFNQYRYTDKEIALLEGAHISYLHLSVQDFRLPTMDQFIQAIDFTNWPLIHPRSCIVDMVMKGQLPVWQPFSLLLPVVEVLVRQTDTSSASIS